MPLKIGNRIYVSGAQVRKQAHDMLANQHSVTAVDVAAALFPAFIDFVSATMEQDSALRFADSQDDVPLGARFTLD